MNTQTKPTPRNDRWTAARAPRVRPEARPIDPRAKMLQDRTSDMGTIFTMLARIRSERD